MDWLQAGIQIFLNFFIFIIGVYLFMDVIRQKKNKSLMNAIIKDQLKILLFIIIFGESNIFAQRSTVKAADSLYQPVQISFLPFLSTSGTFSGNTTSNLSLNIMSGVSEEVRGAQFGGLVNIVIKNARAVQFAGIGNITGESVNGIQGAGIFNFCKNLRGSQFSGVINSASNAKGNQFAGIVNRVNNGKMSQFSGVVNYCRDSALVQIAGIINQSLQTKGCQISGLINNSKKSNVQIASLINLTDKAHIQISSILNKAQESQVQISGIFNKSKDSARLQIGGILNITDKFNGTQIGMINRAHIAHGVQVGIINIADTCTNATIGLINLIKKGYHVLEISGNELFYSNLEFRSGVEKLHGIITAGMDTRNFDAPLWTYGCGLGSLIRLSENNRLGFDCMFQHIVKKDNVEENYLYKIGVGLDHKLANKFSIYVGLTANWLSVDKRQSHYHEYYDDIAPYHLFECSNTHQESNSWLGAKIGLRFF